MPFHHWTARAISAALVSASLTGAGTWLPSPTALAAPVVRSSGTVSRSACGPTEPGFAQCNAVQLLLPLADWAGRAAGKLPRTSLGPDLLAGATGAPAAGYYPADVESAYGLSSAVAGMTPGPHAPTVAIVDAYDDPDAASNLAAYRADMSGAQDPNTGLTNPAEPPLCSPGLSTGCVSFTKVNETGGTSFPAPNSGWSEEAALDLDTISAVCPDCNIVLVEASSSSTTDLATAAEEARSFQPAAITNSYGAPETSSEGQYNGAYAAGPATAVTAGTGDSGYGTSFPASVPGLTAVGGTSLTYTGHGLSLQWAPQTVWGESGSGCSSDEAMPTWQDVPGVYANAATCEGRQVADLSADANPATGLAIYDTYNEGGWMVFGGTSLAAQIVGGAYAVASSTGMFKPSPQALYTDDGTSSSAPTTGLVPVTSGTDSAGGATCNNYLCNAADSLPSGYNGAAGLGTPFGLVAFSSAPTAQTMNVGISATQQSYRGLFTIPVTVTATAIASGAPLSGATGTVQVYQGSSCTGRVMETSSGALDSSGQETFDFHTRASATWCASATVTAPGFATGSASSTLTT